MKFLVIDTESTGAQRKSKGSALDPRNRMCYVGFTDGNGPTNVQPIEYSVDVPFGAALNHLQSSIDSCSLLVFFNAKHDLHWLRRYGIEFRHRSIWDCQLAEFIINGQLHPFPSLDETAKHYGGLGKLDVINEEYWKKGRDTDEIPVGLLEEYLTGDLKATELVFNSQVEFLRDKPQLKRLIWLACQDEIITQEMEWNGLHFDINGLLRQAEKLESDIIRIDHELHSIIPYTQVNWESPKQVSAILYGGKIKYEESEPYTFVYKDPKRKPVEKIRRVTKELVFARQVEPASRFENLIKGTFSTEDKVLRSLRATGPARRIVDLLLERRGTQTQIDRYFRGIPKIYQEMGWQDELVHGQLHHVVAATGRLSSSKPNIQNLDERVRTCLKTRFRT